MTPEDAWRKAMEAEQRREDRPAPKSAERANPAETEGEVAETEPPSKSAGGEGPVGPRG